MDKYLFIVRNPSGKELYSAEIPCPGNLISFALHLMDLVRSWQPKETPECVEIWSRTNQNTMNLLATAF